MHSAVHVMSGCGIVVTHVDAVLSGPAGGLRVRSRCWPLICTLRYEVDAVVYIVQALDRLYGA